MVAVDNYCEGCGKTFQSRDAQIVCPSCRSSSEGFQMADERRAARRDDDRMSSGLFAKRPHTATAADYQAMATAQGGLCAICETRPEKPLVVDHNHRTGKVRALLCNDCNTGLGLMGDNPLLLSKAAQYLALHGYYGTWPRLSGAVRARRTPRPDDMTKAERKLWDSRG